VIVAVGVLAVYLALRWRELGFEWEEFKNTFREVRWAWIGVSGAFALLTFFGRALRWRVLIRGVKPDASLWGLTSATAIGFTAIVLFGRAGEIIRPYLISIKERVSFSSQVAAWLLERMYDLLTALLIFGFALSHVQSSGATVGPNLSWVLRVGGFVAGAVGVISLALLVAFSRYAATMERRLLDALSFLPQETLEKARKFTSAFRDGMESSRRRDFVYLVSLYSILEWTLIILCYVCLFRAFPATAGFELTDTVIFLGFVAFGAVIQIPGVGGGLQVVAVIVLTELFGLGLAESSGIAVMIWITTFVVIVPVGLFLAFREGLNWHKLKNLDQEVSL
jgi:uncharacterized protein (TIRG00374 family)